MTASKIIVSLANTKVPTGSFFSTETALVKVTNELLLNLNRTKSTFYIGFDLSAAFDTLDLLSVLETSLGFKDKVLSFVNSYLSSSRSQKVLIDGEYLNFNISHQSFHWPVF